ncbi:MAG: flagellar biosynthesis protein FlgB [Dactylosporangium sp.]|nr:flagellar biosynthesis protein FlgB [Dactylosporangium sp.]NNJ61983.1 flagellar biosynthesis protein FlgB [Dactylosporangium sp.]
MFDDLTTVTLHTALSGLSLRQRITADNIANINTPGFLAGRVSFEDALADAVADGDPAQRSIHVARSLEPTREDGNNVNLDHETLTSMDTNLRYSVMLRAVDDKFGLLSSAIRGGAA